MWIQGNAKVNNLSVNLMKNTCRIQNMGMEPHDPAPQDFFVLLCIPLKV